MSAILSSRRSILLLCGLIVASTAAAQDLPTLLQVDVENWVGYAADVTDLSKVAKSQTVLTPAPQANFANWIYIADVVAVNAAPAKGVMVMLVSNLLLNPRPQPSQAIGDMIRNGAAEFRWELLNPDGTQIGSFYTMGLSGGSPSPGSPTGAISGSGTIVGGTGPFTGARGTQNSARSAPRLTSQAEDPSLRRVLGGGTGRFLFQIWPMSRPEVVATSIGPLILHSDWTPVSSGKPAQRGEVLIALAKGLGATLPSVNPGDAFPADPLAVVTSPVEVLVGGKPSPAINQVGLPGTTDTYHIAFRVPADAASGSVAVQLSAAWVKGTSVQMPIR